MFTLINGNKPQAKGVGNHTDRRQCHRARRDHRRERYPEEGVEYTGCDRNACRIVNKREEEILPDIAHRGAGQTARPNDTCEVSV